MKQVKLTKCDGDYFHEETGRIVHYSEMMRFWAIYNYSESDVPEYAFNTLRECREYLSNLICHQTII